MKNALRLYTSTITACDHITGVKQKKMDAANAAEKRKIFFSFFSSLRPEDWTIPKIKSPKKIRTMMLIEKAKACLFSVHPQHDDGPQCHDCNVHHHHLCGSDAAPFHPSKSAKCSAGEF